VLYTSGTTGKPKGVAVEHRSVVNEVWHMGAHVLAEGDVARALFATSVCFDASVDELFVPLAFGGSVVVVRNLLALCDEDDAQARAAVACGVTLLNGTPSGVQMLLDTRRVPRTARVVLLGGEALSRRTADALHAELGGAARVINVYGPTEATDCALVERVVAGESGAPLLGRPIGNMCAHVMAARSLTPLPVGVPGELVVQGVGVARGYWRRDELTRERFLEPTASVHWRASDGRAYRTGDLVRRHADGRLEYMGRIDRQVKLRGYRIELDEVEAQLCAFVSDDGARRVERAAAVVTRLTGASDNVLVAYYVGTADETELLARCARTMPKYMVPAVLMRIDAIPLTSTDKVNYKALPAPTVSHVSSDAAEVEGKPYAELSETERAIADIWADVLGGAASAIRSASNFFALGGDSLSAMRAMARLSEQMACELPLSALFQNAVLFELAAFVESKRGGVALVRAASVARVAIELVPRAGGAEYVVSFAQERMWFLDQLFPGGSEYNMPARYEMRGALNVGALRSALSALVARHEALRMRFVNKGVRGVSSVIRAPDDPAALEWREIRVASDAEADAASDAEASRPFALSTGPPIRALLVRHDTDARRWTFVLTAHHIVGDGASFRVIEAELKALYEAADGGADASTLAGAALRPLKYDYVDYAHWQREALAPVLSEQLAYWRVALGDDLSPIELPYDGRHPSTASFGAASVAVRVPSALANAVRGVARAHGATMFMTLLAAWQAVLHVYSRQENVSVGAPIAGRGRSEFDETVGVFVNTLVLRARFGGALAEQSFGALLEQVKRTVLGAFDNQDVPFEQLVKELQPERDERRNPLFQVFFDVSNADTATVSVGGGSRDEGTALGDARWGELAVEMHEPPTHSTQFELALSLAGERDGSVAGELEYASELFHAATAERIAAHWLELLRCVAESEGGAAVPLRDVCLMSASEHAQEREQWNATIDATWPRDATLDSLLAQQAARTPTACAVRDGATLVTYDELVARRAAVARALPSAPGGGERLVGVLMARRASLVAALFGVMHAGAAYVAFDTAWPAERMAYVARDARLSALLSDRETWAQRGAALRDAVRADDSDGGDQWSLPEPVLVDELLERGNDASGSTSVAAAAALPASLAYVLYTSGTTGKPKGVAVEHRSVVNEVWHMGTRVLAEGDVAQSLFATSVCFDASVDELFVPLAFGGSVVVVRNLLAMCDDDDAQARAAVACGLTMVNGTPSGMQMLLDTRRVPRSTRVVLLGGEALSRRTADTLYAALGGGARVINVYGPTEATDLCLVEGVVAGESGAPLLGRPIGNMCAHVMAARSLTPLPVGVPGELVVQGVGVARGYWRRDELTRERFLEPTASVHWRASDGRAYRTGDLVRRHADGRLEYMGRIDRQVKLRGYRIELDEVEAQLCAFVSDDGARRVERAAAVVTRLTGASDDVLVAYYVGTADETELLARCARTMPKYMVPAVLMRIDAIPLTSTDKVNYKALPVPTVSGVVAVEASLTAPVTFVERAVADAFARILGLPVSSVFLETSFFEAGGSSLAAVSLVDAIGRVGLRCTIADVFACPRVGELGAAIAENMTGETHRSVVRVAEGGGSSNTKQLFLVHPAGGSVFCFFEFGSELAQLVDVDVYGVQFTGEQHGSLTKMAERYLEDVLRAADLSRPLLLGGYSFGATVACEIARIARDRDVEVRTVLLLDSAPAAAMLADRWDDADDLKRQSCIEFFEYFGGGEAEGERALAECVAAQVVNADEQVARIAASLATDVLRSKLHQIVATYSQCATLMMQFKAPVYDFEDVVLVLASEDADEVLARDAQRHFMRPLRTVACRGTHLTMLDDTELAKDLAHKLAALIGEN
jgi:amino acid adenylation domain-containing protein